ncbi:PDZ domain-containing protein [Flavobacterium sp. NRK F10]|uniref:PDZ domain-containing protein n=1 Tax=Flavobacterium sp. NRK F10 TaxID=2954931 RepID=UPI002091E1E5|nr:PDZ domain-containing protein [Flavobacterium sp. NRK F10]MCO6173724.1 PDZ domain-containing protein [Flavobacterium sp. NRK F10]
MKGNFKISYCFFFLVFLNSSLFGQFQLDKRYKKYKIPFEHTHNLIILKCTLNGSPLNMILDTGSEKNLLFTFPENDTITFYNLQKLKVKGIGIGEDIEAYLSRNNKCAIGDYVNSGFETLLVPDVNIGLIDKLGIPINGIIGSEFFTAYWVEIDYQREKIVVIPKEKFKTNRLKRYEREQVVVQRGKPYIKIKIKESEHEDEKDYKLLLDTGLGDGLWLFENDTLKCTHRFFKDILGRGLTGEITGKKSRVNELFIKGFKFSEALVSYPDSVSLTDLERLQGRNGSLGGEILKRFNWILNYETGSFYFKKNSLFDEAFNYNMSGIEVQHNGSQWIKETVYDNSVGNKVNMNEFIFEDSNRKYNYTYKLKPIFEIYSIRENSPAEKVGLQVGDLIVSLNGRSSQHLSIQKITEIFQSQEGKNIKIEVERDGENLKFEFRLEKVL